MNSVTSVPKPKSNLDLRTRNTFGFDASAELAYEITAAEQIPQVMREIAIKNVMACTWGWQQRNSP